MGTLGDIMIHVGVHQRTFSTLGGYHVENKQYTGSNGVYINYVFKPHNLTDILNI